MPVTYGYYIYRNKLDLPSLQCDGFLTAKAGDTTTIVKWVGGASLEKTKQAMISDIRYILQDCNAEGKKKLSKLGSSLYSMTKERNDKLLEFGKITFDETSKACNVEATCTTK